jgi:hypothetical protein
MVEEEHEVTDDEPEPAAAPPPKLQAAGETSALKPKSKQASIMGFFSKKPAS